MVYDFSTARWVIKFRLILVDIDIMIINFSALEKKGHNKWLNDVVFSDIT